MTKVRSGDSSMIDDRRGSSGGGFGGGLGGMSSGGFPFPMKAGGGVLGLIVLVAALLLPKILGSSPTSTGIQQPQSRAADAAADGTCSSDLEKTVCGATIDVQAYWQANLPRFFGTEYENTKTVFFTDATSTGCGQASSQTGPFYCPVDHLVYLDLGFMQALEQQLIGKPTDLAEQYIVAHEYGHHIQNLVGINEQVQRAQQNDPGRANQYSVALELQADCFAGMWVGDVGVARAARLGRRDQRGAQCSGRRRRRPHSAEDAGSNRQGGLDARVRGAAPDVVHPWLQLRRPASVRHVQRGAVTGGVTVGVTCSGSGGGSGCVAVTGRLLPPNLR